MGDVFAEAYRLWLMRSLEQRLHDTGFGRVAGVDEAGRGCLAGPVTAAAVVVGEGPLVPGIDDSKKVPPARRERLAVAVRRAHPVHAVVHVAPQEIDRINILRATRRAMVTALAKLRPRPGVAVVDAVALEAPMRTLSVVRGDQISYAVACASILAKTTRDAAMRVLHRRFPHYAFDENKGYGSAAHREALERHGPCEAHRLTFRSVVPTRDRGTPRRAAGRRPGDHLARTG
ncbi:MAG: ribonuclease HII [Acidobacteriota bacterium]